MIAFILAQATPPASSGRPTSQQSMTAPLVHHTIDEPRQVRDKPVAVPTVTGLRCKVRPAQPTPARMNTDV
jgi:hypothetical protein